MLLKVRDTGIGIPITKWDTIFDSFAQADPSTTRRFGGSGLGLAITRHLVSLMGGRIWVESIVKGGHLFLLPFTASSCKKRKFVMGKPKGADSSKGSALHARMRVVRGLRILLVEDNPDNQVLFLAYLKGSEHKIKVASDGKEAFAAIQRLSI